MAGGGSVYGGMQVIYVTIHDHGCMVGMVGMTPYQPYRLVLTDGCVICSW